MDRMKVNGVELAYEFGGRADETVVFLNGIGMSSGNWRPFIPLLGEGRSFLLHDLRGQLLSEKPAGPYSLELHARDLAALLDGLGIASVHVVGTSYGSEVGLLFARLFPERCRSLVVIDGVSEVGPLLKSVVIAWKEAALSSPAAFFRSLVPWTYSERYIRENEAALDARQVAVASLPQAFFDGFVSLCDSFLAIDETIHLPEITAPTLVLVGSEDILKGPGYARIIAEGIEDSLLKLLPGLGHGAVIEDPRAVCLPILEFWARLATRGRT